MRNILFILILALIKISNSQQINQTSLVQSVTFGKLIVETFFEKLLDTTHLIAHIIENMDKYDRYVVDDEAYESLVNLTDANGNRFLGNTDPQRHYDLFWPNWAGSKIHNVTGPKSILETENKSISLINAPRDLREFCSIFHPNGTYQPSYCRNPSKFKNDLLYFTVQLSISIIDSLVSAYELEPNQVLAYYTYDILGGDIYYPPFEDGIGYALGGENVFAQFFLSTPIANPDRVSGFFPLFKDGVSGYFITTVYHPIYLGDFLYGIICTDVPIVTSNIALDSLKVTNGTHSLLLDENGLIILTSPVTYLLLFNKTLEELIVINEEVYLTDSLASNFSNYLKDLESKLSSIEDIYIWGEQYVITTAHLETQKEWHLVVMAPKKELYPTLVLRKVEQSDAASLAIFILCFISLLVPIFFMAVVIYFRKESIVHYLSPPFTIFGLFGSALLIISPIFLTNLIKSCMTWVWFVTLGFVFFFGALLVKSFRIDRIFSLGRKFKKASGLTNIELFPGVVALVGPQLFLLILWTVFTPLAIIDTPYNDILVRHCGPSRGQSSLWSVLGAQIFYYILIIFAACYYSFRTRNIHKKEFREAKEILFAVYNFSFMLVISVIIAAVFWYNPTLFLVIVGVFTVFATTISTIAWLGARTYAVITGKSFGSSTESAHNSDSSATAPATSVEMQKEIANVQ